ncbi:MAG: hypothetical protein JWN66_2664 [Sphingomonas bacterium]|uniref:TonB-dependent receptor n=1 Tax=Sphingomonas bacterium TaxID=1895847 RepID=UPI002612C6DE|nr:TonB-dependent receptor [Sphingomonas bacterium]MDB5705548.1 hypothetical protein [Sphingomonas bacterium]
MHRFLRSRTTLLSTGALAALIFASPAIAVVQEATTWFDIPSQDLGSALRTLGKSARVPISFNGEFIRGKRSQAIKGSFATDAALRLMLEQTGLTFRRSEQGVLFVEPDQARRMRAPAALIVPAQAEPAEPAPVADATPPATDDIVVTGSRISLSGYRAPTPVTVLGQQQLTRDAQTTIGDSIRQLPALGKSSSANNDESQGIVGGTAGLDTVNLRQLGSTRSLVLLDGQRVVASNINGAVDLGTIPATLVKRVDVVTGGASAAYGSDAVAGVINLILDKKFTGLKMQAEYANTYAWDHQQYKFQGAWGTGFADERGHIEVAGTYLNSEDIVFANQRSWNRGTALMLNPAYTAGGSAPKYIHVDHTGYNLATVGGIITSGPLKGIQFVGPNATPTQFNYGMTDGPLSANGSQENYLSTFNNLNPAFKQYNIFAHASYEVKPWLNLSGQFNLGRTDSINSSVPLYHGGNVTIQADNAFLPQSIKNLMAQNGLSSITMGSSNIGNVPLGSDYTISEVENSTGIPVAQMRRVMRRGVVSADGDLGSGWSYNAYWQRSEVHFYQTTLNNNINANYAKAVDAVLAPAGNALGVPAGTVVCRSSLTTPTNGCSPLNIFGTGNASQAAIKYINVTPGQNYTDQHLTQEVQAFSVQGKLPFGLPAGPIAVAFGGEHRTESVTVNVDPGSMAKAYGQGNFANMNGGYNVKEAFLELEVPLIKDGFIKEASLNAAGRVTNYSTSGTVETWKVGLTASLTDDISFRGTISRDIRAPLVNDLFSQGVTNTGSAIDPHTKQSVFIVTNTSGNPNLEPEVARTYTAGFILSPHWLPNFHFSVDYYNIKIAGAIGSINSATVLARCNLGEQSFCNQLVFNGPGGALSQINVQPLNVANLKTSGLDIQADYSVPFLTGRLTSSFMANYVFEESQLQLGTLVNYAGAMGPNNGTTGVPRYRGTFSTTWDKGPWSLTGQVRMIGAAQLVYDVASTLGSVDNNHINPITYLDLRVSRKLFGNYEVFFNVDNLNNQAPPTIPVTSSQGEAAYYHTTTDGAVYDVMGRTYRIGIRARF